MDDTFLDFEVFDKEWTKLAKEISQAIYAFPKVQDIKNVLQKNGFLSMDEKSEFITCCDKIKYELIYSHYGPEGSKEYNEFSKRWQMWFQKKGVESQKDRSQRSSVDHILFGSTPDPEQFLLDFEQETSGSI